MQPFKINAGSDGKQSIYYNDGLTGVDLELFERGELNLVMYLESKIVYSYLRM